jgi:sugar phosphate permease
MVAPLVLAGSGISMAMPTSQNAVVGAVPPAEIGKASGTFNTLRQLGGAFGVAVVVAVFSATGSYASASAFTDGFVAALAVSAALAMAAAATGLVLPRRAVSEPAAIVRVTPAVAERVPAEAAS